jgi:hypothetical protein
MVIAPALRGSLLGCTLVFYPALALADVAVLTPASHDDGTSPASVAAAEQAVTGYFAREAASTRLLKSAALPATVPGAVRSCTAPTCAAELTRAAEGDFTVLVHVFAGDGGASAGSVSAAFVGADGVVYAGAASFGGEAELSDAPSATARALAIARERHQRGPGPWLRVRAPEGSRVSVDGATPVALPYLERHEPGLHRIEVTGPSGVPLLQTLVTLTDDPASYEDVLANASDAPRAERVRSAEPRGYFARPRSKWNYVVGVPLTALGLAGMATGLTHYARRGECVDRCEPDAQGGYGVYGVDALSRTLLYGGAALTGVGGVGFLALGVLRAPQEDPHGMMVQLHGRF